MALNNFPACLAFTLAAEGGFVDNPADPGGATNMGVTLATLSAWLGRPASVAEVQALSQADAGLIYHAHYWDAVDGDNLPAGVDLMLFDFGVNAGPGTAARMLQQQLGVAVDGHIGPQTIAAAGSGSRPWLITSLADAQMAFYQALPQFGTFGAGWSARTAKRQNTALAMAGS